MTNLWLWNYDRNPWKLSGIDTFYSTRKYSRNLKFELNSRKIGLVFLRDGTWYTWTFSLPSTWVQLPWWKIVRCFKSGLHCASLYIAFKALNLLEVSEVFRSFICIFKSNLYVHNHVSQKAKGEISNWDAIPNRETAIQVQAMFPTKNTLTIDTDDQKFNCDNANGHSQTGNWKKISAGLSKSFSIAGW